MRQPMTIDRELVFFLVYFSASEIHNQYLKC